MPAWSRPPEVLEKEQLPGNNQAVTIPFLPETVGKKGVGRNQFMSEELAELRLGSVTQLCPSDYGTRAGWQPATLTIPCLPSLPLPSSSASVVDVKEQSLIAEQRVGVIKFQQVDALARVLVAACLYLPMAVPAVHRQDLSIAVPQIAFGAPLHITYRGQS